MSKEIPSDIKELTVRIEELSQNAEYHLNMAKKEKKEWLELHIERQKKCSHRYADGSSAWQHNYAYSNCKICGYDDL